MPVAIGDRTRLRELFENLLSNAAKFMGNQLQPQIEVGVCENDGETIFYVRDNGIGIAPEYYEKIFNIFQRLHSEEDYPGTGIGLALVGSSMGFKNVIVIMTDTQRTDMLGCYGNPDMKTPSLDRLAAQGIRFDRAYTCQPVCGPARSAMFTGTFPHSNGAWGNSMPLGDNVKTIGQRLRDNGIHTAYIGKWHLASTPPEVNYRTAAIPPERRGGYTWHGNWGDRVAKAYAEWPHR